MIETTVLASGLGDGERDRLHEAEPCRSFRPHPTAVRAFFGRARRLTRIQFLHETDWSACHAHGRLRLRDGRTGEWLLRRGGSASATVGGRTVWFGCEPCRKWTERRPR